MAKTVRRRQFLSWCAIGMVGAGLTGLAGCGPIASQSKGGEIEFWTMQLQPKFTDYFKTLIAEFEAQNPGTKIKWVDVPWAAMESKVLTAVSSGSVPDVINLNPDFASKLASRQVWLNLTDAIPAETRAQYLPKIWQASSLKVTDPKNADPKNADPKNASQSVGFGLPWYLTTRVTIVNQDILKQAGLTAAPKTYAELAIAAKAIKEKTGKYAFFMTVVPEDSSELLESMVQMGVTLVDGQGKAAFNSPEGKAAFQYWVDLYQAKLLPQEVLTQGHRRAIEMYQSGETAILSSGAEFLQTIETNAPQVAKASAASPQISGSTGKSNVAVMNLVIPKASKAPEAALKFALFVTDATRQLSFAKAANVLPSETKALSDYQAELKSLGDKATPVEQARSVSSQQLGQAEVLVPAMPDLNLLKKAIYNNLQSAMLNEKTVDQALSDAAQDWNKPRS
jgi:putative chitobiose transport system substrate-binding protein